MPTNVQRIQTVFLVAAAISDPADRARFLDGACDSDTGLRSRVEALLRAHDQPDSLLDHPAVDPHDPDSADIRTIGYESGARTDDEAPLAFLAPATRPDSLGRIGHYEVLQVLGQGGFGIVFRAFDNVLHRVVAVKVLSPQMAATAPARKRFLREARSSAQVRHENVVQVYEVGERPLPYIVMEFIPGETLQQRLDRTGPVEAAEVVRIGRQIAEGLAAAHVNDLIHRDIKPGNILLEGGAKRVKITDFGLARAADDASISQSGIIAGTPMYMAPEQANGDYLDHRADLFSLGSVLYQMVAGRPPFRAKGMLAVLKRVAEDTPRPIREIIPETPQWLCDIISKLHAKNPEDRFQSAREVADLLSDCENQLKANSTLKDFSRIPQSKQPAAGKSGRWKWAAASALLLPVLALAVTEFAGVTHLFRDQQATHDRRAPDGNAQAPLTAGWHGWPADAPASAVAPFDAAKAKEHQDAWAEHLGVAPVIANTANMKLTLVPPGEFEMAPGYRVRVGKPYRVGSHEVTVGQFRIFVKGTGHKTQAEADGSGEDFNGERKPTNTWQNPEFSPSDQHPVLFLSWEDATKFCEWLSKKEKKTYRLPTEAEWEWACRAGSAGTYHFGDSPQELGSYAWYGVNSGKKSNPVEQKKANAWGLFDMHGNIAEFCRDWHAPYPTGSLIDPAGPPTGTLRAVRSFASNDPADRVTCGARAFAAPRFTHVNFGFRVLLEQ